MTGGPTQVFALLVDSELERIGINYMDQDIPPRHPARHMIDPFNRTIVNVEHSQTALREILLKLGPEVLKHVDVQRANICYADTELGILAFAVPARLDDEAEAALKEVRFSGRGIVRSFAHLTHQDPDFFRPGVLNAIQSVIHNTQISRA